MGFSQPAAPKLYRVTRYFTFTRTWKDQDHVTNRDYINLIAVSNKIDSSLFFKTIRDGEKIRLLGVLTLCGPTTIADDIARLLPNFNVMPLGNEYIDPVEWMVDQHAEVDGPVFHNYRGNPFRDVRKQLF